jgi:hypothetical protein
MIKIYYDGYSKNLTHVADRRRFGGFLIYNNIEPINKEDLANADIIVLTQASDLSWWLKYKVIKSKIVFDFCDAYLLEPTSLKTIFRGISKFLVRQESYLSLSYKKLIQEILKKVDIVVCASEKQKESVLPYCKNVHIILDFQDKDITHLKDNYRSSNVIDILWEGLPSSLLALKKYRQLFIHLNKTHKVCYHFITDMEIPILRGVFRISAWKKLKRLLPIKDNISLYQWNSKMFSKIATACDFAIIPINTSNCFQNAKAANKLHLLWRMGIPVISSATPSYIKSMQESGQSLYCKDMNEWIQKIELLVTDHSFREMAGKSGREFVNIHHSERVESNRWSIALGFK